MLQRDRGDIIEALRIAHAEVELKALAVKQLKEREAELLLMIDKLHDNRTSAEHFMSAVREISLAYASR
jgi:hypothetical protein